MTGFLFELTFFLAAPVWLLMILAPAWRITERVAGSPLTVLPILVVWAVLAAPVTPELWAAVSSPDIDTFRDLMGDANGAGAIWAQIIAWDLLLGQWMYREARRLSVPSLLMAPLLVLTILLSPIGLPLFLVVRAVWTTKARRRPEPAVLR
ncbi:ABA4-like family protein [Streptomyces sp. NBC_00250]|uniref:ABA4-like family protein n=1 Tax=Streptomyces sp. NBC_00250 TaxID=2903641 RepID=UPI002E296BCF|nr:ABA4-like family protein [Streptomyces sp. NBC_00250]